MVEFVFAIIFSSDNVIVPGVNPNSTASIIKNVDGFILLIFPIKLTGEFSAIIIDLLFGYLSFIFSPINIPAASSALSLFPRHNIR